MILQNKNLLNKKRNFSLENKKILYKIIKIYISFIKQHKNILKFDCKINLHFHLKLSDAIINKKIIENCPLDDCYRLILKIHFIFGKKK